MNIGRYRNRLTFQRRERTQDKLGQESSQWVDVVTVWGYAEDLRGRDFFAAQQAQSEVTTKIGVRYMQGVTTQITSDMRVRGRHGTYEISAIFLDERRREVLCLCKAVKP